METILEVNADNWEKKVLRSNVLTVVDFWHERCPWCLRLDPIYREAAEEYKDRVKFVKLNVLKTHRNREIAIQYGVMNTPTLIFFCAGRPVEGVIGFMSKDRLKNIVKDMLERHRECVKQSTELGNID